ncbi:substrate-binding periplasmic protein [Roseateles saccharophilus]|uniref:Amino acid ABC transporter substrate-binding protein (PAAT family) n=1 Tax=Roseateles saccharophilus TaxID=304 RepID=A0A4R3V1I1_ROSSA|nr:transporter substrate-binding domain-containing protein [Roseateles saccharophilus]MDG0832388.1 transporter substrate-binding domain-containing protein [Roseateles saccharophilus]TCU97083.1 amino acid ABC transporter substrate-binding protein (PAAT family) [Roseateles saccharophilus]
MDTRPWWALLASVVAGFCAAASAKPLVMLEDTGALMPHARIENGRVVEGVRADLGAALARRLGRDLQLRTMSRKRMAQALARGEADMVCGYQRDWLPGPFGWSHAFIPDESLLVTSASAPAPRGLADLAGQPVGTVLGHVYPEMDEVLHGGFVRDDAPNAVTNLHKLQAGRVQHALIGRRMLEYQQRIGHFRLVLHPPVVVSRVLAQCALGPASPVGLPALNSAIDGLVAEGELTRILARYR